MPAIRRALFAALVCLAGSMTFASAQDLTARGQTLNLPLDSHIDMEFRFDNYFEVLTAAGTIVWDPAVVDFGGVTYTADIGGLDASSFYDDGNSGQLAFQWQTSNILGATVPNNTVVFTLRFNTRDDTSPGATTQVAFSSTFMPLRFTSATRDPYPFQSTPGEITVVPEPVPLALIAITLPILLVMTRLAGHRQLIVPRPR